jgi:hypothetical protein
VNEMKMSRREFVGASAAAAVLLPLSACTRGDENQYQSAERALRAPLPGAADVAAFVRFATLAANGHNTQPWRFAVRETGASITPDLARRTPAVDPDDHHLFVSLGCAAENFARAVASAGRPAAVAFDASGGGRIDIDLARGPARADPLARAIPARQSTRSVYDGRRVASADLDLLAAAARVEGVSVVLITDPRRREAVLEHVVRANALQMDDPAFMRELRGWLRFNPAAALRSGDGLLSRCSGSPTLPTWIGRQMFDIAFRKAGEAKKYREQMRSSAGVAVFVGDRADAEHWTRVGRSFQRFALQATALGIRHAHVNQPIEVPAVRVDFARWLGAGGARPDLVVRFGYAPPMPMSMRRPVGAVMASNA